MKREMVTYDGVDITTLIVTVRGKRVILDRDLAALYGVPTFRFNEAVKRNRSRFPEDFIRLRRRPRGLPVDECVSLG
jgi:hypothetical protein